jgi:hypothetical protein
MANSLTGLIPDFQEAMDVISRELVGMIPAVKTDARLDRVAIGQNVTIPVTQEADDSANNTPGVNAPDTGDATVDNVQVAITKSKHQPIRFNGEETLGLTNAGTFSSIQADRTYQAMRKLVNEIEADLWATGVAGSSWAYGTAETTPFGTANDLSDFAGALGLMEKNGAPTNDLQLVLGHSAMANLRGKQAVLFKVNEAGSPDMLRNGMTDRVQKMALRHSDAVGVHTKGTGDGFLLSAAHSAGDTTINVDTGTGTVLAGDIVTFNGDTTKYVVTSALSGGSFTIGRGLVGDLADGTAVTVGDDYTGNLVFDRNAIALANRMPAAPQGGDMAVDVTALTDPMSGLTFEFALYKQFLQNVIHVRLAWGTASIKSRHVGTLLG